MQPTGCGLDRTGLSIQLQNSCYVCKVHWSIRDKWLSGWTSKLSRPRMGSTASICRMLSQGLWILIKQIWPKFKPVHIGKLCSTAICYILLHGTNYACLFSWSIWRPSSSISASSCQSRCTANKTLYEVVLYKSAIRITTCDVFASFEDTRLLVTRQ